MSWSAVVFRHRSSLLLPLVAPLLVWGLDGRPPRLDQALVGVALVVLGVALRLSAARCLGRGARVHRADARGGLVSWGPYAWSRNPLYLAAALLLAGFGLVAGGGWWALLLLPTAALIYTPVVMHEEGAIRTAVGDPFDRYRQRVWRWVGPRRGDPASPESLVPWAEVLRRERLLVPGVTLGLVGVALVHVGHLPLRVLAGAIARRGGVGVPLLCGLGLALAAAINSAGIERKRARHDARRAAASGSAGAPEGA